ncbi:acyl carrier protein [Amycolatopsis panacis]|uniref:Acyl carrier protein n=1 Tax=Amycolatopsis panacis TaxID=2340917 RepID=A0A419HWK0_9PSEU|nr:acyl carrier protein [Amycolatopsis panacis]RJQ81315.1 acyl carrier protein [Amycolatopsis panacis]
MNDEEIRTGFAAILDEVAGTDVDEVTMERSFEELDIDSLLMVEVVVAAEDRFGVSIPEDSLAKVTTVGDIVGLIQGNLAAV